MEYFENLRFYGRLHRRSGWSVIPGGLPSSTGQDVLRVWENHQRRFWRCRGTEKKDVRIVYGVQSMP